MITTNIPEYDGNVPLRTQVQEELNTNVAAELTYLPKVPPAMNAFAQEANLLAQEMNNIAAISGSFKGSWVNLSGAHAIPTSVYHAGKFWVLLQDIANISAEVPGVSLKWAENTVNTAGGAFSLTTGVDATLNAARVQSVVTTVANLNITIPTILEDGGPAKIIYNRGANSFYLYYNGLVVGQLRPSEGVMVLSVGGSLVAVPVTVGNGSVVICGVPHTFDASSVSALAIVPLDATHFCILWSDAGTSGYGYAMCYSVSGMTVTNTETPYQFEAAATSEIRAIALDATRILVAFIGTSGSLRARVLSIGGSFYITGAGTVINVKASVSGKTGLCLVDVNKAVLAYQGTSSAGTASCLSVAGTTITAGTAFVFAAAVVIADATVCKLSTLKALVGYRDITSVITKIIALSISGTTITAPTVAVTLPNTEGYSIAAENLDTDKALVGYRNQDSDDRLYFIVVTAAGTVLTVGMPYPAVPIGAISWGANLDSIRFAKIDTDNMLVCIKNRVTGQGQVFVAVASGNTISTKLPVKLFNLLDVGECDACALSLTTGALMFSDTYSGAMGKAMSWQLGAI